MKKTIFAFILGMLVSGSVVFAANYLYHADEVSYEPTDTSWRVDNVDSAIKSLYSMINTSNEALTNLKNTDIAKAVKADGNDFPSVINKLGTIVDHKDKSFTLSDTNALTIPAGYYNGTGTITTSGLVPTPTGSKTITANGSNIDVKNYATVNVDVSIKKLCNEELGVTDCEINTISQFKKQWSAKVSVTYKGYGGNASGTFDMKKYVNVSPINYFKIEDVQLTSKSGSTNVCDGGWAVSYTPGVTYNYSINGSVITINTQNSTGGYGNGSMYYGSTITATFTISGYLL